MAVSGKKAECVDRLQSVKHAWCEPCEGEEDGRRPAAGFCENCEEYICEICLTYHKRSRAGKSHSILSLQDIPSLVTTTSARVEKKSEDELTEVCPIHTDEVMKYFCLDHNQICCVDCRVESHTTCKQFEKISKLCANQTTLNKFDSFDERLSSLTEHIDGEIEKATGYTQINEKQCQKQQEDVNKFVEDITNTLARLKKEFQDKTAKQKQKNTRTIELVTKECQSLKKNIETLQSEFDMLKCGKKLSKQFVLMKKAEKDLYKWEEEEKRIKERNQIEMTVFSPDSRIKVLFEQVLSLGILIDAGGCCTCKIVDESVVLMCGHKQCVKCVNKPCGQCGFLLVKHRDRQALFQGLSNLVRCFVLAVSIHIGWTHTEIAVCFAGGHDARLLKLFDRESEPNCILIEPSGRKVHSFGNNARRDYTKLVEEGELGWFFIEDFMDNFDRYKEFRNDAMVESENKKTLPVKDVMSILINFLKEKLEQLIKLRQTSLMSKDIHWVLTVPATWSDSAVQFISDAAQKGGIPKTSVTVMYESDAALNSSMSRTENSFEKCLIIDVNGKGTDITVYKRDQGHPPIVIHTSGRVHGFGSNLTKWFLHLLENVPANPGEQKRRKLIHREIMVEIDSKVRHFKDGRRQMNIKISDGTLRKDLAEAITAARRAGNQLQGKLRISNDILSVESDLIKNYLAQDADHIARHIAMVLQDVDGCSNILLVGEASESCFLQQFIQQKFPEVNLVKHYNSRFATVEGAAIACMKICP